MLDLSIANHYLGDNPKNMKLISDFMKTLPLKLKSFRLDLE